MAGIYLHWPFCIKRCIYCDFHSSVRLGQKDDMIAAMKKELSLRKDYLNQEEIETIYWGGGTPSLLSVQELNDFMQCIHQNFKVNTDAEITLECNPDDLTLDYLISLREIGFNRISIGIQSFNDIELKKLLRRHTGEQAYNSVVWARKAGFDNLSIDLIYGLPESTLESWNATLTQALHLDVEHISAYHLIYEEKTLLDKKKHLPSWKPVEEENSLNQFNLLLDKTKQQGYEHYEISNFALNQQYSKHNTSYWKGSNYLGVGASAHSYNGNSRQWNIAHNMKYIAALNEQNTYFEVENLSIQDKHNEFILTSLRTMWGIHLPVFENHFGFVRKEQLLKLASKYLSENKLSIQNNAIILTESGKMISDQIMSNLMWV